MHNDFLKQDRPYSAASEEAMEHKLEPLFENTELDGILGFHMALGGNRFGLMQTSGGCALIWRSNHFARGTSTDVHLRESTFMLVPWIYSLKNYGAPPVLGVVKSAAAELRSVPTLPCCALARLKTEFFRLDPWLNGSVERP